MSTIREKYRCKQEVGQDGCYLRTGQEDTRVFTCKEECVCACAHVEICLRGGGCEQI